MILDQQIARSVSGIIERQSSVSFTTASVRPRVAGDLDPPYYPMWRQEYSKVGHTEARLHVREIAIAGTRAEGVKKNSAEDQIGFFRKIAALLATSEEWDPESRKDLARAVNDAIRFIVNWPRHLPLPSAGASEYGEVAFHWSISDRNAIVRFEGDGAYGYALLKDGRYVSGEIDVSSPSEIPSDIKEYLSLGPDNRALP